MYYDVDIIIQDSENDLAVLVVPGIEKWSKGLPISHKRYVRESIVVPGFPPHVENADITFSSGRISNPSAIIDEQERIKLEIALSPGNSGGPLMNEHYEILGVVYMKVTMDAVENVAYAIPIIEVLELIDSIENYTDEKVVKSILKAKVNELLLLIQFYNKDTLVPLRYFTHGYNKVFQTVFFGIYLITNSICTNNFLYSLDNLPDMASYRGKKLINEIYTKADEVDLFKIAGFHESDDEYELILLVLCYRYICYLMNDLLEFQKEIETIDISQKEYENILSIYTDRLSKMYINCLVTEIVMHRFKDREIDSFEIVDIDPDLHPSAEKCSARIYIKIKYPDSLKNLKIQAAYSRGRWGISSITGASD